jgi:hypothetical protein
VRIGRGPAPLRSAHVERSVGPVRAVRVAKTGLQPPRAQTQACGLDAPSRGDARCRPHASPPMTASPRRPPQA